MERTGHRGRWSWLERIKPPPWESHMDVTTLLIIVLLVVLLGGGGWYGRGRWYGR